MKVQVIVITSILGIITSNALAAVTVPERTNVTSKIGINLYLSNMLIEKC